MNVLEAKKSADGWLPVRLVDSTDLVTPETGLAYGDLTVEYCAAGGSSWTSYSPGAGQFPEVGDGDYWLQIGADEFSAEGLYFVHIECAGCADVHFVVRVRDKLVSELIDDVGTLLTNVAALITGVNVATFDMGALTSAAISSGAITAAALATGAITADKIAASAITADKIATAALIAAKFGAGAIDSNALGNNAITSAKIAAGAIGNTQIADDALSAGKFDETTAFPLTAADSGSTAVARTGADADTLETISDQLDTVTAATGDIYVAHIHLQIDDPESKDRYSVRFFKNAELVTAGITTPTITVTDDTGTTVLITAQALTDQGSGRLLYTATGAERTVAGTPYEASVTATIDGSPRTFARKVGRDV